MFRLRATRVLITLAVLASFFAGGTFSFAADNEQFTIVVLPDTQFYSENFPDTYMAQTSWIRDNVTWQNIKCVVHLGDLVQNYNDVEEEWQNADKAHKQLDGVVPYSVAPGNHDLNYVDKKYDRETVMYNKYFGPQRFKDSPTYGGHFGDSNDNNFNLFEAGGMKFMVVALEYAPRDEVLDWAGQVIADHPDHRVIVTTHSYMNSAGRNAKPVSIGNSGEQIWEKLIRKYENVFMVICGHISSVFTQTSTGDAGNTVIETLVDYQNQPNGGDGWLRIMRFVPAENKIRVTAYSSTLKETNDDPANSFVLDYQMSGEPVGAK